MTLKYCRGSARQAERVLGWNRDTVEWGLHEQRTGIPCWGAPMAGGGKWRWEEQYPAVAEALWALAESHCQQDPAFRGTLSYPRLTAAEALPQLRAPGFPEDALPSPSTMAAVLNRNGYRLRPVVKAKPQQNSRQRTPSLPTWRKRMGNPSWGRRA